MALSAKSYRVHRKRMLSHVMYIELIPQLLADVHCVSELKAIVTGRRAGYEMNLKIWPIFKRICSARKTCLQKTESLFFGDSRIRKIVSKIERKSSSKNKETKPYFNSTQSGEQTSSSQEVISVWFFQTKKIEIISECNRKTFH